MAIVKFGPTVVGARGTIAGTIFSANKGGPYARGWSKSANPASTLQQDQRGRLGARAAAWRNLTQPQRVDWDDYANDPPQELTNSLGETYFASGFNWYIRINDHLEAAGEAVRVDAPTLIRPSAPVIQFAVLRITGGAGDSKIRFSAADPALGANHLIVARLFESQGRTTASLKHSFIRIAVPDVNRDVFFDFRLNVVFGTIALGQRIFYASQIQDAHGQRGPDDTITEDAQA